MSTATDKVLKLLEAAAAPGWPHRLGTIATAAGVPKASAHRILRNLVLGDFLSSADDGTYAPGPRLRALAALLSNEGDADESIRAKISFLSQRTGNTVHVAVRSGDTATYTHKVAAPRPVQMASQLGGQIALHSTAIGKCILSGLSEDGLAAVAERTGLPARTERTITDLESLRQELDRVRDQGFAVDDEENEANIRCLGAPIRDASGTVIGAVSVSTLTFLVPVGELLGWTQLVVGTAAALSEHLS
jgi:DNA-binding IclR family transcriptional regulator